MAFVPYIADLEKWKKHFIHMADGKAVGSDGLYVIGKTHQTGGSGEGEPVVKYVTPTAQAVEQAESELKYRKTPTKRSVGYKSLSSTSKRRRVNNSLKQKRKK